MNKTTTSNTSIKKSLLAGLLDETRAASRRSDATSAVQAKAGGKAGSVMGSTATDPKPVQTFLSDALEKALAATNAAKSDVSTARAKAGGFTGATAGQTTTAYASQQTQNRLKDAVDAAIDQVNAMKATNDSYVDEQTVRPTAEQKRQAALVARLPEDFPIDEWESLPTKAQLKKMQNTRLSKTEQWDLLNTKTSMSTLRDIGEQTASQTAMLQAAVDRIMNGEVTNSSKLTPLQQRVLDRQLEKEESAMRSVAGRNWQQQNDMDIAEEKFRLRALRNSIMNDVADDDGSDASILTDLQQRILDRQLAKEEEAMRSVLEPGISGEGDGTLFDWNQIGDTTDMEPLPFPAPVPVIRGVPYPENGEKAYIFYTNRPKGWYWGQARYQKKLLESQGYEVEMVCTNNVDDFSDAWNTMDPKTTTAVIISHSNGMSLIFEEGSSTNAMSATGLAKDGESVLPAISDLDGPEIARLYIYACNAGHEELLAKEKTNVADAFRDLANVDTVYAFDGSVGFGPSTLIRFNYQPRLSNEQNYGDVFENFEIPDSYGQSGTSGFLEYESDD